MKFSSLWLNLTLDRHRVYSKRFVYERVLAEIGNAIRKSTNKAENIEELPTELIDQIIDDETEIVEYLLGTAFVLCQAYITDVVSTVMSLHKFADSRDISLKTTTNKKQDILRFRHEGDSFSPAEVIDGFANYFKHRDEWVFNWQKLSKDGQKITVKIIKSAGAESGGTGNLRQGSIALGNLNFVETGIFLDKLEQWHLSLIDAYRTECERTFLEESIDAYQNHAKNVT
jgi:hypothetical protein